MSSSDWSSILSSEDRQTLVQLALASIKEGLDGQKLKVDPANYSSALQEPGASFVTINVVDELRGCVGSLEAARSLALDVTHNAHAAAFSDPRFPALKLEELRDLHVHISLLGPPEAVDFTSEADLIRQLRPGVDGVILQEGTYRATYLPTVWEALPDPRQFLQQLKRKAGLSPDHWSEKIEVQRYTTESID